jgi:hypothetical protein
MNLIFKGLRKHYRGEAKQSFPVLKEEPMDHTDLPTESLPLTADRLPEQYKEDLIVPDASWITIDYSCQEQLERRDREKLTSQSAQKNAWTLNSSQTQTFVSDGCKTKLSIKIASEQLDIVVEHPAKQLVDLVKRWPIKAILMRRKIKKLQYAHEEQQRTEPLRKNIQRPGIQFERQMPLKSTNFSSDIIVSLFEKCYESLSNAYHWTFDCFSKVYQGIKYVVVRVFLLILDTLSALENFLSRKIRFARDCLIIAKERSIFNKNISIDSSEHKENIVAGTTKGLCTIRQNIAALPVGYKPHLPKFWKNIKTGTAKGFRAIRKSIAALYAGCKSHSPKLWKNIKTGAAKGFRTIGQGITSLYAIHKLFIDKIISINSPGRWI